VGHEATLDLLGAADIDGADGIRADDDATGNAGALGEGARIAGIGDGGGGLGADGGLGVCEAIGVSPVSPFCVYSEQPAGRPTAPWSFGEGGHHDLPAATAPARARMGRMVRASMVKEGINLLRG
jgi:hypothetical protein